MEQIESVIFDWGGVLIDDLRPGLLKYCANTFGLAQEDYAPTHDLFLDEFHKGLVSEEVFWQKVCERLNKPMPEVPSLWTEAFKSAYVPRPEVFSLASTLRRSGYKTALLSNTELPTVEFCRGFDYDMFDMLVFSCVEGTMKPERRIYEITLERLGTEARRSVFVDDRDDYVQGAKEAGINAIIFENLEQVKSEFVRLGVRVDSAGVKRNY
jgi:HAD superfamily hydrolase (TIGR01509 family)